MKLFAHRLSANARSGAARAAFTMVEIALCLAIIGFALVAIIGVLPTGLNVQKENREETIINFDAAFLMDAMSSGSHGSDILTNYVLAITNYLYTFTANTNNPTLKISYFTPSTYSILSGPPVAANYLTNGEHIIGLLSLPKFRLINNTGGSFYSNYTTADFRAMNSPMLDQGTNSSAQEFSFHYRVVPEITAYDAYDPLWTNYNVGTPDEMLVRSNYYALAVSLGNNLAQVRLRYLWPVLANGTTGSGRQVYRTLASGQLMSTNVASGKTAVQLWFVDPGNFTTNYYYAN